MGGANREEPQRAQATEEARSEPRPDRHLETPAPEHHKEPEPTSQGHRGAQLAGTTKGARAPLSPQRTSPAGHPTRWDFSPLYRTHTSGGSRLHRVYASSNLMPFVASSTIPATTSSIGPHTGGGGTTAGNGSEGPGPWAGAHVILVSSGLRTSNSGVWIG
jgi:hypothetical protein